MNYKGYTQPELLEMFRSPNNSKYKFPEFLDSLKEKECTLKNTSEVTSENALESSSTVPSLDSLDTQSS